MIQGALKFLDILKTELDDTVPSLFVFAHIVTSGAYFFLVHPAAHLLLFFCLEDFLEQLSWKHAAEAFFLQSLSVVPPVCFTAGFHNEESVVCS